MRSATGKQEANFYRAQALDGMRGTHNANCKLIAADLPNQEPLLLPARLAKSPIPARVQGASRADGRVDA